MVSKLANILAVIYIPTMWCLAVLCGVLGLIAVTMPGRFRPLLTFFTRRRAGWLIGLVLLLLGAEIFVRAPGISLPALVRFLGVFVFVIGGVAILIPTVSVIIAEWFAAWSNPWLRVLGLVNIGLAYVFYLGTKVEITLHVKGAVAALCRYFG